MSYSQITGIIIEGLSCSGKTSVFNSVKKLHGDSFERTILAFSENYSQILYKRDGLLYPLGREEHYSLLNKRLDTIKQIGEWGDYLGPGSLASRGVFVMFERFHLNHKITFPESNTNNIEQDIRECNIKTLLLTISPEKVYERLLYRNKGDKDKTNEEVLDYIKAQDEYISLARKSAVDTMIVNTDSMDWDNIAAKVMAFIGRRTDR